MRKSLKTRASAASPKRAPRKTVTVTWRGEGPKGGHSGITSVQKNALQGYGASRTRPQSESVFDYVFNVFWALRLSVLATSTALWTQKRCIISHSIRTNILLQIHVIAVNFLFVKNNRHLKQLHFKGTQYAPGRYMASAEKVTCLRISAHVRDNFPAK